jgi:serine/threonine-protein kinase OSR1/STK39
MPLLGAGSMLDVIQIKAKDGIKDEVLIATILKEVLLGLQYFHEMG